MGSMRRDNRISDYCFFCSEDLKGAEVVICSICFSVGPKKAASRIRSTNNKNRAESEKIIKHMEDIARNIDGMSDEQWEYIISLLIVGESTDLSH